MYSNRPIVVQNTMSMHIRSFRTVPKRLLRATAVCGKDPHTYSESEPSNELIPFESFDGYIGMFSIKNSQPNPDCVRAPRIHLFLMRPEITKQTKGSHRQKGLCADEISLQNLS